LAVVFPLVVALGFAVASPLSGDSMTTLTRLGRGSLFVSGVGVLALFPWPIGFLAGGDRLGALAIVFEPIGSVSSMVRFITGPNGGGIGGWAFVVAGLAVTLIANGERAAWCLRLWGIVMVAWVLTLLPNWFDGASPAVDGMLVPVGLAFALIGGIGVATFFEEARRHGLGWRHALSVLAAVFMTFAALGFMGDAVGGRWHQPSSDWNETLDWTRLQRDRGPFRVLWLGRPDVVPGPTHRIGADAFGLTNDGPGDLRDENSPPGGAGMTAITDAVTALRSLTTTRFGRLVAPMAIRYIAVPQRPDPGAPPPSAANRQLIGSLEQQLDLREADVVAGLRLYENTAWRSDRDATAAGTYLWSQQYSDSWEAASGGKSLRHRQLFGWTNGFANPGHGPVDVSFTDQWWRWPAILAEVLIIGALVRRATRRRRRDRRARARASANVDAEVSS
jgi:hypothetical protein